MVEWVYKEGCLAMSDNNFVVYAYVRSKPDRFGREGTFYYIGKGRPGRPYENRYRKGAQTPKDKEKIIILHSNLSDEAALNYEKQLIKFYGRVDLYPEWGILRNLTDGGEGGSGAIRSREFKDKLSVHADIFHPEYGEYKNVTFNDMRDRFPEMFKSRTCFTQLVNGTYSSYFGWTLLSNKEELKTINNKKEDTYCWIHDEYGKHENLSVKGLIEKFPELKLDRSNLYSICWGKKEKYRGWVVEKEDGKITCNRGSRGKIYNWIHETYGEEKCSVSELVKKYHNQGLSLSLLCRVVSGRCKSHKGWKIEE